jgi:hypothetical protein
VDRVLAPLPAASPQMEGLHLGGEDLLQYCVFFGEHPLNWVDGMLMLFEFPNGLICSVIQRRCAIGMEVGVRDDVWLYEVVEKLSGDEVREKLVQVMERR